MAAKIKKEENPDNPENVKKTTKTTKTTRTKKAEVVKDTENKEAVKPVKKAASPRKKAVKKSSKKILFVSSESAPFITTGGLGEVIGALPKNLRRADKDMDVRIVIPLYEEISLKFKDDLKFIDKFYVDLGWRRQYCGIYSAVISDVTYYFIDNEYYFKRPGCYGYFDDGERFAFFGKAVLDMLGVIDFIPDIIHAHDWQSAIVPVYLKTIYSWKKELSDVKTVFTVHNIEYQGKYSMSILGDVFDIPYHDKHIVEFDKSINLMKGAMTCSDIISTVSPSYAREIHGWDYAHGLDPVINTQTHKIRGILNGIDTESYDPKTDTKIVESFNSSDISGKLQNKLQLQTIMGLPKDERIPIIAVITRLVSHKGMDLIIGAMHDILQMPVQFVVLGSGDRDYERQFELFSESFPDKISVHLGFNSDLARRIYAGADMFLMPSKSEPCGLSQMIAARYGTVPLVRATGGLRDSIIPYESEDGQGIGFVFEDYRRESITEIISRAYAVYNDTEKWEELVKRVMNRDFSWGLSAKEYIKMYNELLGIGEKNN